MTSIKWTTFYDTEEELVADMLKTFSDPNSGLYYKRVQGYGYIDSFKKYYAKHGCLTEKQMVQLKRLAQFVYANVHNDNIPCNCRVELYERSVKYGTERL